MAQLLLKLGAERPGRIPNWMDREAVLAWWCWQAKLEAGGPARHRHSSHRWRVPKQGKRPQACKEVLKKVGDNAQLCRGSRVCAFLAGAAGLTRADGDIPNVQEVVGDCRYCCLCDGTVRDLPFQSLVLKKDGALRGHQERHAQGSNSQTSRGDRTS